MKYTISLTDEQDIGLAYAVDKHNAELKEDEKPLTAETYISFAFGHVCEKYLASMRIDEAKIVSDNFVKTGTWEVDVAVIKEAELLEAVAVK